MACARASASPSVGTSRTENESAGTAAYRSISPYSPFPENPAAANSAAVAPPPHSRSSAAAPSRFIPAAWHAVSTSTTSARTAGRWTTRSHPGAPAGIRSPAPAHPHTRAAGARSRLPHRRPACSAALRSSCSNPASRPVGICQPRRARGGRPAGRTDRPSVHQRCSDASRQRPPAQDDLPRLRLPVDGRAANIGQRRNRHQRPRAVPRIATEHDRRPRPPRPPSRRSRSAAEQRDHAVSLTAPAHEPDDAMHNPGSLRS